MKNKFNERVDEHLSDKKDNGNRLWLLLNSEVWYRMHIKDQSKASLYNDNYEQVNRSVL